MLISRLFQAGSHTIFFLCLGHPPFFLRLALSDRPNFLPSSKKSNDVVKPFLCRIGVSVVDPFSHVVLILQ